MTLDVGLREHSAFTDCREQFSILHVRKSLSLVGKEDVHRIATRVF
jgi:hypothetical protein